MFHIASSQEIE